MIESSKPEPTPVELISWAIPNIARGNYRTVDDDPSFCELVITEWIMREEVELEMMLDGGEATDEEHESLVSLRNDRSEATAERVVEVFLGLKGAKDLARTMAKSSYHEALELIFHHQEAMLRRLQNVVMKEREGVSSGISERVAPRVKSWLLEAYATELGELFPKLIDRAERLEEIKAKLPVSPEVNAYLIDASKCYVYGRLVACVILCRSVIEFALRKYLIREGRGNELKRLGIEKKETLAALIELARSVAQSDDLKVSLEHADDVRKAARAAIHKAAFLSDEKCEELFIKTRGILGAIYS